MFQYYSLPGGMRKGPPPAFPEFLRLMTQFKKKKHGEHGGRRIVGLQNGD
jgi:hypothetical protein